MRIIFPPPGFFVNDPLCTIHVNGWCAYSGSFVSGLDVRFPVVLGPITVKTRSRRVGWPPHRQVVSFGRRRAVASFLSCDPFPVQQPSSR